MSEPNKKKLNLNKETIRNLSDESLEQVSGGGRKDGLDTGLVCVSQWKGNTCVGSILGYCCN